MAEKKRSPGDSRRRKSVLFKPRQIRELQPFLDDDAFEILENHYKFVSGKIGVVSLTETGPLFSEIDNSRVIQNIEIVLQIDPSKAMQIVSSIPKMIGDKSVFTMALVVRGHLECVAHLGYFCHLATNLLEGKLKLEDAADKFALPLMGAVHETFKDSPKPIHINDYIRRTDRYLSRKFDDSRKWISEPYNWLSEYCHPILCLIDLHLFLRARNFN